MKIFVLDHSNGNVFVYEFTDKAVEREFGSKKIVNEDVEKWLSKMHQIDCISYMTIDSNSVTTGRIVDVTVE